jgi:hypothetical protein
MLEPVLLTVFSLKGIATHRTVEWLFVLPFNVLRDVAEARKPVCPTARILPWVAFEEKAGPLGDANFIVDALSFFTTTSSTATMVAAPAGDAAATTAWQFALSITGNPRRLGARQHSS